MTPKQSESLYVVLGYLDAYECGLCGGSEPGQHTEGCPVLELREMVTAPEKPETLYDWSKVPEWVQWIARDKSGRIMGYDNEPSLSIFYLIWVDSNWNDKMTVLDLKPNYPVEWQNSLEARPK